MGCTVHNKSFASSRSFQCLTVRHHRCVLPQALLKGRINFRYLFSNDHKIFVLYPMMLILVSKCSTLNGVHPFSSPQFRRRRFVAFHFVAWTLINYVLISSQPVLLTIMDRSFCKPRPSCLGKQDEDVPSLYVHGWTGTLAMNGVSKTEIQHTF